MIFLQLLFLLMFTFNSVFAEPMESAMDIQDKAISQFKIGRFREAADLYRRLLKLEPNQPDVLRDLLQAQWNAGLISDSIETAKLITVAKPDDVAGWSALGRAYASLGRHGDAKAAYQHAREIDPNNNEILLSLARVEINLGALDRAEQMLLKQQDLLSYGSDHNSRVANIWKMLAERYLAKDQYDKAILNYSRAIQSNPNDSQTKLAFARLYIELHQYDKAEAILTPLSKDPTLQDKILPKLARICFLSGKYAEAIDTWESFFKKNEGDASFKFQYASALYHRGRYKEARDLLENLLSDENERRKALDFLVDDDISQKNFDSAIDMLFNNLPDLQPEDDVRLQRLVDLALMRKRFNEASYAIDKNLQGFPQDGKAQLLKAESYMVQRRLEVAAKEYLKILDRNPYSTIALTKLVDIFMELNKPRKVLDIIRPFRERDPRNPNLLIQECDALYELGHRKKAKALLNKWLNENNDPVLTVLLYHGLVPADRDPLLAYTVHMNLRRFENQMKAIKEAGMIPVTANDVVRWYRGEMTLQNNSVLITFDDGRVDSFKNADPILEKYGLKATAFIITQNVDRKLPAYASWNDLRRYIGTGRWEIQAHGDFSHSHFPVTQDGHKSLFLFNRIWLNAENRLETEKEWEARIQADHERCVRKLSNNLGIKANVFAFPEGNYGQLDIPNFRNAAKSTLALAKKIFDNTYVQDRYGFNVRSSDPFLLSRMEPRNNWTGEDLVRHIKDNSPFSRIRKRLLRWAVWEGRYVEGTCWLEELKKHDISEYAAFVEDARIHASMGDLSSARKLISQANGSIVDSGLGPDLKDEASILRISGPKYEASFEYSEDSSRRQNYVIGQAIRLATPSLGISGLYRHGHYKEKSVSTQGNGLGLKFDRKFGFLGVAEAEVLRYFFTGKSPDRYAAQATLGNHWNDQLFTGFSAGIQPLFLSQAIQNGIFYRTASVGVLWNSKSDTSLFWQVKGFRYSDKNRRYASSLELGQYLISNRLKLLAIGQMDHVKGDSTLYYTPHHLAQGQVGFGFEHPLFGWGMSLRYLPGYGEETGTSGRFVQNAGITLSRRWKDVNTINLSYDWDKTPSYRSDGGKLAYQHQF